VNVESLHVENFKSIREVDVEFSDLNVFVGRNAAGKSNLFEVFQFLRDARDEGIENAVQMQGGAEYARNKNIKEKRNTEIKLEFEGKERYRTISTGNRDSWDERVNSVRIHFSLEYESNDYVILKNKIIKNLSVIENKDEEKTSVEREETYAHASTEFNSSNIKTNNSENLNKHETSKKMSDLGRKLDDLRLKMKNSVKNIEMTIPERENPKIGEKFDIRTREISTNDSLAGRADLQTDGSNLVLVIKNLLEDEKEKKKFLSLVSDVLPFVSDTKVEAMPDQSLFLEILEEFEPGQDQYIPAEMLSDGTLRVLALIYLLYFSDHEKIFIEEPGRNIHPSLIANLMLKVKDAAENTDKQIFLTTHNVEVLRHTPPEDVRLVSRDEDGFTQVERPAESERVQKFLENDLGMVDLYTENMLGE